VVAQELTWAYPGFVDSFQFGIMRCFA
jgi:hypothetical protein